MSDEETIARAMHKINRFVESGPVVSMRHTRNDATQTYGVEIYIANLPSEAAAVLCMSAIQDLMCGREVKPS